MVNPFTLHSKISKIQQEVLDPLYCDQNELSHSWLLAETGRVISRNKKFIQELCSSRLISTIFKVIKVLGGADQLTVDDFDRFTGYVNDGGLDAMVTMLVAADQEKSFLLELRELPLHVQVNAPIMLRKARCLHEDFINSHFKRLFGDLKVTPTKLQDNFVLSDKFMERLVILSSNNQSSHHRDSV